MAGETQIGGAFIRVRADTTGFVTDVRDEAKTAAAEATRELAKIALGAVAFTGIAEFVREVGRAASSSQAALAQVQQTAVNVAHATAAQQRDLAQQVEENAAKTGFTVVQVSEAYGRLLVQTKDVSTAQHDLALAEDIARGRHIDLAQAATVLARAEGGSFNSLSRLGIIIPKVGAAQAALGEQIQKVKDELTAQSQAHADAAAAGEKLTHVQQLEAVQAKQALQAELATLTARKASAKAIDDEASKTNVLQQVQERFAGQTARYAETAAGAQDRFKVSVEELQASIGQHYLPAVAGILDKLTAYLLTLQHSKSFQEDVTRAVDTAAGAFKVLGQAVELVGPPLIDITNTIAKLVEAVGPGPILAFYAAFRAGKLVAEQFVTGEVSAAAAAQAATVATTEQTAAVERLTAALTAEAVAARAAAVAGAESGAAGLAGAGSGLAAMEARNAADAAAASTERGLATRVAGGAAAAVGLGGLSLTAAGATAGVALLAGGLYYLSTRESDAHRAGRELSDTLTTIGTSATAAKTAAADLADATGALKSDQAQRSEAALGIAQAREQLAVDRATHASKLQLAADVNALKAADQAWRDANHQTLTTQEAVTAAEKTAHQTEHDRVTAISDLTTKLDASIQVQQKYLDQLSGIPRIQSALAAEHKLGAKATDDAVAALERERVALGDQLPGLSRNIGYLETFIKTAGRVPASKLTTLILEHGSADKAFQAALAELEVWAKEHPTATLDINTSAASAKLEALVAQAQEAQYQIQRAASQGTAADVAHHGADQTGPAAAQAAQDKAQKTRDAAARRQAAADRKQQSDAAAAASADQQAQDRQAAAAAKQQLAQANRDLAVARAQAKADAIQPTLKSIRDQTLIAVAQAKANLQSLGSTLASTIGSVIDAMTTKATNAIQKQLDAEQRAATQLQQQRALADATTAASRATANAPLQQQILQEQLTQAQEQLAALQAAGPQQGQTANDFALSVAQGQEAVVQAQQALQDFPQTVKDAQQQVADAQRAIADQALTDQQTALTKRAELEKTAAAKRIDDLTDELNRGQITARTFNAQVAAELKKDDVNYKDAGSLLGKSFADGFKAQLATIAAQISALGGFFGGGGGQVGTIDSPGLTRAQLVRQRQQAQQAAIQRLADARRAAGAASSAATSSTSTYAAGSAPAGSALGAIQTAAAKYGLDWRVLAAVASTEGGLGAPQYGDYQNGKPTSAGLFQLHLGGALPANANLAAYLDPNLNANTAARMIASLGSIGSTPSAQIANIVRRFERPAKPDPEIEKAIAYFTGHFAGQPAATRTTPTSTATATATGKALVATVKKAVGDGAAVRIDHLTINAPNATATDVANIVLTTVQKGLRAMIKAELGKRG